MHTGASTNVRAHDARRKGDGTRAYEARTMPRWPHARITHAHAHTRGGGKMRCVCLSKDVHTISAQFFKRSIEFLYNFSKRPKISVVKFEICPLKSQTSTFLSHILRSPSPSAILLYPLPQVHVTIIRQSDPRLGNPDQYDVIQRHFSGTIFRLFGHHDPSSGHHARDDSHSSIF